MTLYNLSVGVGIAALTLLGALLGLRSAVKDFEKRSK